MANDPQDEPAEATLRSLRELGGEAGALAASRAWSWTEKSSLGVSLSGALAIPKAWRDGLGEGPEGEKGRLLAKALAVSALAKRKKDAPSGASPMGLDWVELVKGVSFGEIFSGPQGGARLAQALSEGISRAQKAWISHAQMPRTLDEFRAREKMLDARAMAGAPKVEEAMAAFERWDDGLPKSAADLDVGRALALASFGLENIDLDRGDAEPAWRGARKLMESAKAAFCIPAHYAPAPQSPLLPKQPLTRPALAGGSGSRMFERADGRQYHWVGNRTEVFDNPLFAARQLTSSKASGSTQYLLLPDGSMLDGRSSGDAQSWAKQVEQGFRAAMEREILARASKAAPKTNDGGRL